jgi:hypothetical protein
MDDEAGAEVERGVWVMPEGRVLSDALAGTAEERAASEGIETEEEGTVREGSQKTEADDDDEDEGDRFNVAREDDAETASGACLGVAIERTWWRIASNSSSTARTEGRELGAAAVGIEEGVRPLSTVVDVTELG